MKKHILSILAFSVLAPVPFTGTALAQESQTFVPPGSEWVNQAEQNIKILNQKNLIEKGGVVPQELQLSIVHHSYMEPDQFGILMKVPQTVTGCFDISPIGYEAKFIADLYMDINVTSYTVTPKKTQHVEYACNQGYQTATGLIVVSANDLRSRGTRQIRFTNGLARDNYNIIYSGDSITLQPQSMIVFKAKNGNLTYGLNPQNIISLEVPMAKEGDDISEAIRTLAAQKGLSPVTDMESLPPSMKQESNDFYYVDETGRYTDSLNENGYAEIGVIPVARAQIDENGASSKNVPLKVFVKKH